MISDLVLQREQRDELPVHVFTMMSALGVDAFVTDRVGGVSGPPYDSLNLGDHVGDDATRVAENRARVAAAAGVAPSKLVVTSQVHGCDVVSATDPHRPASGDVLTLTGTTHAVAILVADCVPVILVHPGSRRLAVAHAGWRGLSRGVLAAAVGALGGDACELVVGVGPSISLETYQVGPEVAAHFVDVPNAVVADVDDRSRVDLRVVATHQLVAAGVLATQVHTTSLCTDGGELFFSDRAQRPCGRFGLIARWAS